jgi:hypothetical protein
VQESLPKLRGRRPAEVQLAARGDLWPRADMTSVAIEIGKKDIAR